MRNESEIRHMLQRLAYSRNYTHRDENDKLIYKKQSAYNCASTMKHRLRAHKDSAAREYSEFIDDIINNAMSCTHAEATLLYLRKRIEKEFN